MQTTTKALMMSGGVIALAALLAALRFAGDSDGEARRATAPATTARPERGADRPAARPVGHERRWSPGATYVYEIENARTITVRGDTGPSPSRALGLSGRLSISVIGPVDDGIALRLALDEVHPGPGATALPLDAAQLSGAFHAVVEPTGRFASLSFPRGLDGNARATLKVLASALQLVVPGPAAAEWRTTEQDASGEYEAAYSATGDAIHKIKERFVRVRGPRGLGPVKDPSMVQIASSIDFAIDASGWPRLASEDETLTVAASAMRIEAKSRTAARLTAVVQHPDPAELARVAAAERDALEPEPEADAAGFATARRHADEGLVDGASYAMLLGDLAATDVKLRNRTMARMAALFRTQPDAAAQAAASILHGNLGDEAAKRVIGALGGAGTADAQRALSSILDADRASAATRDDAAAALGMTRNPSDDTQRALARAARSPDPSLASTATLGLGNVIKHMNEQASGDPSDALALLVERLQRAASDPERILCLDALGNSGDPGALPAIEPYLASATTELRATAVGALRFLTTVDDRLVIALQDSAASVRRAAASALSYRAITPMLSVVTLVLHNDPDPSTRLALVAALRLRKRAEPGLAELLAWAAEHDPAPEVRNAARSAAAPS
jgi:hypothetical protein